MGKILGRRYRFVDDYKKKVYVGSNGKSKQKIIYIGQWVCPLNEKDAFNRIVLISRIAAGVLLAAVIAAMLVVPLPLDHKWYMPVTAIAFFPILYAVMGVVAMPQKKKPMERMKFQKSFERAKGAAAFCLVVLGIAVLAWIVCWILAFTGVITVYGAFSVRDGAYLFCMGLAAAACFVLIRQTKQIKTELRDNSACKPE